MANKTKNIILIVLCCCVAFLNGQQKEKKELSPIIKSAVLPGWGQKSLGFKTRARSFQYIETSIILAIIGTTTFSNIMKKNYIAFASQHANISSGGKNHDYWVDIGNFDSINEYNAEHLRNREEDALYPDDLKWSWEWDSPDNRRAFENKRIQSDQLKLAATFGLGALALNHIVSSIDALYLTRTKKEQSFTTHSIKNNNTGSFGYVITFHF